MKRFPPDKRIVNPAIRLGGHGRLVASTHLPRFGVNHGLSVGRDTGNGLDNIARGLGWLGELPLDLPNA